MNKFYKAVAERAHGKCEYCLASESVFNFLFEIDHFIPLSEGGTDDLKNLVLACRACNSYKAFHQIGLLEDENETRLFNPRTDVWMEHFRFGFETLEIESLTEIGNGTINRLKINSSKQIESRKIWVEFGLYP